jgi:hypothetical protein
MILRGKNGAKFKNQVVEIQVVILRGRGRKNQGPQNEGISVDVDENKDRKNCLGRFL